MECSLVFSLRNITSVNLIEFNHRHCQGVATTEHDFSFLTCQGLFQGKKSIVDLIDHSLKQFTTDRNKNERTLILNEKELLCSL